MSTGTDGKTFGVVELFTETRVKLVEASYQNIKITTPEDMKTAEAFLED